jgi:hypothetical protein
MTTPEHGGVPETRVADFAAFVRPREGGVTESGGQIAGG